MDRVDLRCRYTRVPTDPSEAFPERKEDWTPVVDVGITVNRKGFRVKALLDSGSSITLFGTSFAEALGIDWQNAPQYSFQGVGSTANPGYVARVTLTLIDVDYSWEAPVVFSPAINHFPFVLLGHVSFFEHFEVRFRTAARQFRILRK
jgi:hypothetical protein